MSWPIVSTRRLFRVVNGGTPTSDPRNWDGDIKWATPVDLASVNGGFIEDTQRTITPIGLMPGSCSVPKGSIILSTRAPIGYVAETVAETAFNQGCRGLLPRVDIDTRFFRYHYSALADNLAAYGLGSTFMELSGSDLAATKVSAPPLSVQRIVADFLDAETARIDMLIAKKRQMVRLLIRKRSAQMLQSIWLDTPYHAVRLRHLTGRPTSGNRDHGEFIFATGNTGVPCLRGLNIKPAKIDRENLLYIDEATNRAHSSTILRADDLVIVRSGFAGSAALVPNDLDGCNCVDLVLVRKCTNLIPRYLEYVVNSERAQEQVRQKSSGALLSHFNAVDAGDLIVPYRELPQQERVAAELDLACLEIDRTVELIQKQIMLLKERRQALITAAVTGEMDVPGVSA